MKLIARIILHILGNALAIFFADRFVPGFIFSGDWKALLIAGLVLALINMILRPILKLLLGPLILLTFGLFYLVINAFLLYLLDLFVGTLTIDGYMPLFYASLLVGVVNFLIGTSEKIAHKE